MVTTEESWWHSLNEECPITLELLSTLPYPPFSLISGNITSYFDGLALASYIVSRGIFQNPLTREELTLLDCRRLDDYLEAYCYNQLSATSRKISVAEAYVLRASVHVDQANRNLSRARALQSTATAALAGLFVYGNDRRRNSRDVVPPLSVVVPTLPRHDQLILDWGFDLTRTVNDSSSEYAQEGWTVIDDDEAIVVASEREAYQATQNAFPRLQHRSEFDSSNVVDQMALRSVIDAHIVERVRELSVQEEQERNRRERQLALARQQLLQEALARRDVRKQIQQQKRAEGISRWAKDKQEQEEITRARTEIEQWREEQWKKLRLLSEDQAKKATMRRERNKDVMELQHVHHQDEREGSQEDVAGLTTEAMEEHKKAKAAEKRKRAKQRKKAQKAEERVEYETLMKQKEREAKQAASAYKCTACGKGMLDSGFEKYGRRFCSTLCARSAQISR